MDELRGHGFSVVWPLPAISVRDIALPADAMSVSKFPLARYMRAFDVFAGAAGYNTCCEVVQAGVPSLLVPNTMLADDQSRRAEMVSRWAPVVVSSCDTREECREAVLRLLSLEARAPEDTALAIDGAERAADEILALVGARAAA
jgi:predicted glycosyltransferase